jgi:hypothetical protein
LGLAKLCGAVVIVTDKVARLEEWPFTGCTFDSLGERASHLFVGDGASTAAPGVPHALPLCRIACGGKL